jgi:hypothetical protein
MTKPAHFEGALGFAALTASVFIGLGPFWAVGEMLPDMDPKGVLLVQLAAGVGTALLVYAVFVGISSFARYTPVPVEYDEGEQK